MEVSFPRDTGAGLAPAAYAVRWLLDRPGIVSVVVGCRTIEQLRQLSAACGA